MKMKHTQSLSWNESWASVRKLNIPGSGEGEQQLETEPTRLQSKLGSASFIALLSGIEVAF